MNNLQSKFIGAVVGGGLGYIVGSIICDVWCPEFEEVENEVEDTEKLSRFERASQKIRETPVVKAAKGDGVRKVDYNKVKLSDLVQKYKPDETLVAKNIFEQAEAQADLTQGDLETFEPTDPDAPFVIAAELFDTLENYRSQTLYYYTIDDVTTDEKHGVVPNIENIIGDEALTCFGQDSGDSDLVYVRVPKMKCDYEIIRHEKSYSMDILGMKRPATKVTKVNGFHEEED